MQEDKGNPSVLKRQRHTFAMYFVWLMMFISFMPSVLLFTATTPHIRAKRDRIIGQLPLIGSAYQGAHKWYSEYAKPVEEMRVLTAFPATWQGRWFNVDRNYTAFEGWYGDHLGLRDLMIRSKNEIDYQLFRSSSRVYYGKDGYIYGRNLVDRELPATEEVLNTPQKMDAVYNGIVAYAEKLQAEGVTPIFVLPMQKQYLIPDKLPFFAPRIPQNSHFMALYSRLRDTPGIHFVDVYEILKSLRSHYEIYYKQDFHWTDMSALEVASRATNMIAEMEKSSVRWDHPIKVRYISTAGSDARFSARLNAKDQTMVPELTLVWPDIHTRTTLDPQATGLEFETDTKSQEYLLPPTCMYGNSFSDGMLYAGLTDYYQKFTKLDRTQPLSRVPELVKGRCKYVIIQVLDIQAGWWASFQ